MYSKRGFVWHLWVLARFLDCTWRMILLNTGIDNGGTFEHGLKFNYSMEGGSLFDVENYVPLL